jgi:hypothetical protein
MWQIAGIGKQRREPLTMDRMHDITHCPTKQSSGRLAVAAYSCVIPRTEQLALVALCYELIYNDT